ncbi:right-handed parallel beta-helix repeat-containing protein [Catenulispora sp. NL8]|uniref:Right-handed parallel beta-helix repeat-containing protein n=1 Tax=Catenulispora pinistramenti TaxID=2705254 RepID=A0ABS5L589_9ACTN|nr:right-handed parallel beta-helix repeat-containing protein [Catenulispora pinistramenti]MBS2553511.1 right-handed parallel beta-helix repeat-containing protein [Catenulispora pinistramenti]
MLTSTRHPVLARCTIEAVERVGVTIGREGIALLRSCTVSGTGPHGIFADHGSAPSIDGCRIENTTGNGITARAAAEPRVSTTVTSAGGHGVTFQNGAGGAFENCDITGAAGSSAVPSRRRPARTLSSWPAACTNPGTRRSNALQNLDQGMAKPARLSR